MPRPKFCPRRAGIFPALPDSMEFPDPSGSRAGSGLPGCYFRISAIEWLVLIVAIALVFCAEALNTALERTVDLLEPERHPVARDAKDLAAAGVLHCIFVFIDRRADPLRSTTVAASLPVIGALR